MISRSCTFRKIISSLHRNQCCSYSSSTTSVDSTEISHFNKLAAAWWDPHGSSGLLHQMNPLRHQFISSCLNLKTDSSTSCKRRYLDIGCGGGIFTESAARLQQTEQVLGIDPSEDVIAVAKEHARQDPLLLQHGLLEYRVDSIENLPLPRNQNNMFDVVTLFEVIEHISQPAAFLASCLPHVKPGGWLVVSTIARTWTSWLTTKLIAENILNVVPVGTHDWKRYINEHELETLFLAEEGWGTNGGIISRGCVYVPGLGWKMINGGEKWGNYFFGVRKAF